MDEKDKIRKLMIGKRTKLSAEEVAAASAKVMKNLFAQDDFLKADTVGFYEPIDGEIDVKPMIERANAFGKTVFLPRITPKEILFDMFTSAADLVKGPLGIMEPKGGEEAVPEVLVVPGVAFDLERYRLGFGKGYYDKYLAKHESFTIGVCHEFQVVDKLPRVKTDKKMDLIIAEDWILE